jgi:Spy/CpxP family protein refolding chaperone
MKRLSMVSALAMALFLSFGAALVASHASALEGTEMQKNVYGSQLMTLDERKEYHAKMGAAKTAAEREQVRKEHHARMKARAHERGVTLPDEPPARASGMGGGSGIGPGDSGVGLGGGLGR